MAITEGKHPKLKFKGDVFKKGLYLCQLVSALEIKDKYRKEYYWWEIIYQVISESEFKDRAIFVIIGFSTKFRSFSLSRTLRHLGFNRSGKMLYLIPENFVKSANQRVTIRIRKEGLSQTQKHQSGAPMVSARDIYPENFYWAAKEKKIRMKANINQPL